MRCSIAWRTRGWPMSEGGSGRGAFLAYNAALTLASPALLGWFGYRVLVNGKSRDGWAERLGWPTERQRALKRGDIVWFHAVSVGEVAATAPVVRAYLALPGARQPAISTITATGHQMARKVLPEVTAFYLPVDLLPPVRAVVGRLRPRCLALCEAEIWPNLLSETSRAGAGVALFNGRVTDHMLQNASRHGWIFRWALSHIDRFLMQTEEDAERIISLGARPEAVTVTGNTKFDEAGEPLSEDQKRELAERFGVEPGRPAFVAGSTNPGEDEVALQAFLEARRRGPDLFLLIAPRQVERAPDICRLAESAGLSAVRRSTGCQAGSADVLVLDTFGELAAAYALGRVAFVGGTFVDKGGHNILQPLAQGVPVVYGPYDYKIRDIGARARQAGVAFREETPEALASRVAELASGRDAEEYRRRALELIRSSRGASEACARAIFELAEGAGQPRA